MLSKSATAGQRQPAFKSPQHTPAALALSNPIPPPAAARLNPSQARGRSARLLPVRPLRMDRLPRAPQDPPDILEGHNADTQGTGSLIPMAAGGFLRPEQAEARAGLLFWIFFYGIIATYEGRRATMD